MSKQQVNIRISDATREKLDALTSVYGTQAEVVAVAIDRMYQQTDGTTVVNSGGARIDFIAALEYMDGDIREQVHGNVAPCTNQEFFAAYAAAHLAYYDTQWEIDKSNPTW